MRAILLVAVALDAASGLSLPSAAHSVTGAATSAGAPPVAQHPAGPPVVEQRLDLIGHAMPIMAPHLYEEALRAAFAQREIVRWYIARVDEAAGTAVAEVVVITEHCDNP